MVRVALAALTALVGCLVGKVFQELRGHATGTPLMDEAALRVLFDRVSDAGEKAIQEWRATPVVFSSIDSTGAFGPVWHMQYAPGESELFGQNKLLAAYGGKARSKWVPGQMAPFEHTGRHLVSLLNPAIGVALHILGTWGVFRFDQIVRFSNQHFLFYLGWQGAVPVFDKETGAFVAAFAASGASGQEDESCIDAGLEAAGLEPMKDGRGWLWSGSRTEGRGLDREGRLPLYLELVSDRLQYHLQAWGESCTGQAPCEATKALMSQIVTHIESAIENRTTHLSRESLTALLLSMAPTLAELQGLHSSFRAAWHAAVKNDKLELAAWTDLGLASSPVHDAAFQVADRNGNKALSYTEVRDYLHLCFQVGHAAAGLLSPMGFEPTPHADWLGLNGAIKELEFARTWECEKEGRCHSEKTGSAR